MSDLLLGLVIGVILVVFVNPFKGVIFMIRDRDKQIAFLRGEVPEPQEEPSEGKPETRPFEKDRSG
jgi:hypothetical protein